MNILFLTTHFNTGGITSYIMTLATALKNRGHNVYIATSGGNMVEALRARGIEHITLDIKTKSELSLKIYLALPALARLIREEKINVIHTHTRVAQVMGTFLSRMTGVRHITTCHGFFKTRLGRKIFPCWGDAVIAISQPVKDHLIKDFAVAPEKIFLVHNGIDLDTFKEESDEKKISGRAAFGLKNEPVVGIVARLSDVKGHKVLILAMKKVIEKVSDAKLLIVGQGKIETELKSLASDWDLEETVQFYPIVNDTPSVLSLLDVFAMPSLQEGLGLSIMEAQAMALPVVASRVGGIPSLIEDGKTGFLVTPGNVEELAQALIDCLTNKEKAKAAGRAARKFIEENFPVEKMAKETVTVYEQLVKKEGIR